jgi:hypothetical protein
MEPAPLYKRATILSKSRFRDMRKPFLYITKWIRDMGKCPPHIKKYPVDMGKRPQKHHRHRQASPVLPPKTRFHPAKTIVL